MMAITSTGSFFYYGYIDNISFMKSIGVIGGKWHLILRIENE